MRILLKILFVLRQEPCISPKTAPKDASPLWYRGYIFYRMVCDIPDFILVLKGRYLARFWAAIIVYFR